MSYEEKKQQYRNEAIEYQNYLESHDMSYGELLNWSAYFERVGKKYGLLTEFRENGIC